MLSMSEKTGKWSLFVLLSIIWGSSFILMKEGLVGLTAIQVASVRILFSGIVLLPISIRGIRHIPIRKLHLVFLSGAFGSLFPAYLFCIAGQKIDSSLAGALNSLTPIFVIITGALFFKKQPSKQKVIGIFIAFMGSVLLFLSQSDFIGGYDFRYILFIVLATFFYGLNVNLVLRYLTEVPSLQIVAMAMQLIAIPAFFMLYFSGFFTLDFAKKDVLFSIGFSAVLGILGTSLANILFYKLIKKAGAVFSSMVTYGIPFVAFFWGILYHEQIGWMQVFSLSVILLGVYYANRKSNQA